MQKWLAATLVAGSMVIAGSANAATSFVLTVGQQYGGTFDYPVFELKNTSTSALLQSINLNFAPSTFNIDRIFDVSRPNDTTPQINYSVATPGTSEGGTRSDGFLINFTSGFQPGDVFRFKADFDLDSVNSNNQNFRSILFNNGAAPNALLSVGFSDGVVLSQTLQDGPEQTLYTYTGTNAGPGAVAPVPEPATWAMMLLGFFGLGGVLRRRTGAAVATA